ncbi:hypothetical protein K1X76_06155 [bacterium]|nr:hypothetical protein [bacterium]
MKESLDNLTESEFVFHTPVEKPAVGQYFKKNGHFDGRLFHSMDKVTYTFISQAKEVISLHFDKTRNAIFYKGHNVANTPINAEQWDHLEKFKSAIASSNETKKFIIDITELLNKIKNENSSVTP